MINKYVCKGVFEAVQWTGDNYDEIRKFGGRNVYIDYIVLRVWSEKGRLTAEKGDYIIKDDCGILWVCSRELFNSLFEEI